MSVSSLQSFAVIGTGAVGGLYGAILQRAGFDVHFLIRSGLDEVRRNGLRIESIWGDFSLPSVQAYGAAMDMPRCDAALVATKTTANEALPQLLPHVLKPGAPVVLLQNGLNTEQRLAEHLPDHPLLGGLCFLCSHKLGPGHIRHLDYGGIRLGEYRADGTPAGVTPAVNAVIEAFRHARIEITPVDDLVLARWLKLVWNVPYNGLSVLLDADTDQLMRSPHALALVRTLMAEVQAAARSQQRNIPDAFIAQMLDDTLNMKPYHPSMKLDYDQGRPLEFEAIYGEPLRTAEACGITTPCMRTLYHALAHLDAHRPRPRI